MSEKLIYKKMSEVMRDVKAVTKDQKNTAQGFKFRGIDQFVNALYPALTKHGVFMTPFCTHEAHELKEVVRSSGKTGVDKHVTLYMCYNFFAEDGSSVTVGPIPAEGLDSGDKATNKALSAALKYALIQTFSIPTEDMAEADLDSPVIETETKTTLKSTAGYVKVTNIDGPNIVTAVTTSNLEVKPEPSVSGLQSSTPRKLSSFRKPKEAPAAVTTTGDEWT